jgi:cysteine desulfurase
VRIYLDHNAGAPLRAAAREATEQFIAGRTEGNPASVHFSGQRARRLLEQARSDVASMIGAPARSIVFTSGGTEANNLAIFGGAQNRDRRRIVTSAIEHSSILRPVAELERSGFEVIRLPVDQDGRLSTNGNVDAIDRNTALVTLGLVNSEVGTIQDLLPVAGAARRSGAIFHIDAAQAIGRMQLAAEETDCDLMTISGHKLGGPAGIGSLYIRPGCALAAQLLGGPQEAGMRAGTPNLCGAVGFGAAAREAKGCMATEQERITMLSSMLLMRLQASICGLHLNGSRNHRSRNTLNLTFPGVLGESLLIALDLEGIEISMGSACAAGAVEPSHVLLAMGRSPMEARFESVLGGTRPQQRLSVPPKSFRRFGSAWRQPSPCRHQLEHRQRQR